MSKLNRFLTIIAICLFQMVMIVAISKANYNKTTTKVIKPVIAYDVKPTDLNEKISKTDLEEFEALTLKESSVQYSKPKNITYTVKANDNLWNIAETFYGDGYMSQYIIETNNMNSDIIREGQSIEIAYPNESEYEEILTDCITKVREQEASKKPYTKLYSGSIPEGATLLGKYKITGYDPYCSHCCGKTDGITACGKTAVYNYSVGAPYNIPFGTKIYIEGLGIYEVYDRGHLGNSVIDIVVDSHAAAYDITRYANVYILN